MTLSNKLILSVCLLHAAAMPAFAQVPERIKFLHEDAFGNLVAVTDEQGQVTWNGRPEPFGAENTPGQIPRFLDKQRGAGGLHLLGARIYDPASGRFLTPDPQSLTQVDLTNPQRLNRYAYGLNNPYRYQDPSGEVPLETVMDIVDIGMSAYDMYNEPSWTNAGLLTWSIAATVIPYVPGAWVAKAGKAAEKVSEVAKKVENTTPPCNLCFAPGTPIHTADGLEPIESLQAGDLVWAQNDVTGLVELKKIVRAIRTENRPLVSVELESEEGQRERLRVTPDHPFWVENQGWTPFEQIRRGQRIATVSGGWLRVGATTFVQAKAVVHNLEVEDHHTYFAGELGAWAHNCNNLVYESYDASGKVQYVGITNNYFRRAHQHLRSTGMDIVSVMQGLSRKDARSVEQVLIELHGLKKLGGSLRNRINSIARGNPIYESAIDRGLDLLIAIGYKL